MKIGFHISISKGFRFVPERAVNLGCDTFQIFPGNPRGWSKKPISSEDAEEFKKGVKAKGLSPIIVHSTYLPRLNSPKKELRKNPHWLFRKKLNGLRF